MESNADWIRTQREALDRATAMGDGAAVLELTRRLAKAGDTSSMVAYARMLEAGTASDEAESAAYYYGRAALRGDGEGAYRYGRMVTPTDPALGFFFLRLAAVAGYRPCYGMLISLLFEYKEEAFALTYAAAAAPEEPGIALALAGRYADGRGTAVSLPHAKWALSLVPRAWLRAPLLWWRLRGTTAEAPRPTEEPDVSLAVGLYRDPLSTRYPTVKLWLCTYLAEHLGGEYVSALGQMIARGEGTEADGARAERVLTDYGVRGEAFAYLTLCRLYREGIGVPVDIEKARSYAARAADAGLALGYVYLGDLYSDVSLDGCNPAYGIEMYDMAVSLGSAEAQEKSHALKEEREALFSRGLAQSRLGREEEAFRLYAVSAAMGYTPADIALGRCYELGVGVARCRRRAFLWYERAAQKQQPEAYLPLGLCYSRGIGTRFDFDKALRWLGRAAAAGFSEAREERECLQQRRAAKRLRQAHATTMELLYQKKFSEAAELCAKTSQQGYAKATFVLGCMFEFGAGVDVDRGRAYTLYTMAAEGGFADPTADCKLKILRILRRT